LLLTDKKQNLALDIIAVLLNRRKHLKLVQIVDLEKVIPDIEERLKSRKVEEPVAVIQQK
jgi:hypothetical protein